MGYCVNQGSLGVKQIARVGFRQRTGADVQCRVVQVNIHGKHVAVLLKRLGNGDDRLAGDTVGIYVGENDLPGRSQCVRVPGTLGEIETATPFPGIGRDNLSVNHSVGIYATGAKGIGNLIKVFYQPLLNCLRGRIGGLQHIHIERAHFQRAAKGVDLRFFFQCIAFYQCHAQLLRILQKLDAHKMNGKTH